ncbi:30S ribosomal protein S7 [archaeon]|nr:MAG: 30S ribosomal protein S7 [archaeon]
MSEIKLFGKWPMNVEVSDMGLRPYINLKPVVIPKSGGRLASKQFHKSKMSIIERLMTKQMVPGHRSKKHVLTSGMVVGKWQTNYRFLNQAFDKIEKVTKKNPVEVLVKAIENASTREEIAAYQVGGIIVRRAVITSPQRRVDLALRNITQAAYRKSFGKKTTIADALADEIIAAYNYDLQKSEAIKERDMTEKQAEGAR